MRLSRIYHRWSYEKNISLLLQKERGEKKGFEKRSGKGGGGGALKETNLEKSDVTL